MKTIRTAVLVSGGGTNLQAIIDASRRGEIPHASLELVLSSKAGAYALERAAAAGIPAFAADRKTLGSQEAFEAALLEKLEEYRIEVIVLAGFLSILSADFVRRYPNRILNVHPALIPAFCGEGFYGLKVHEAALARGVKVTGATVHFVNEVADGGPIIAQKAVKVREGDTPEKLQKRVMRLAEWKLLPAALEQVAKSLTE
ncbi:MAG: phosphoribosylglycinamide formyltransferase [Lachnospiraceae bacterium]|nr:phosphoribosylglycinamide formyltransferase [Lachnospiraceae bacterium]